MQTLIGKLASLAGCASLAWLGLIVATLADEGPPDGGLYFAVSPVGLTWFAPSAYLAVWHLLLARSASAALGAPLAVTAICFVTFHLASVAGAFSFVLLALPVGLLGAGVTAVFIASILGLLGVGVTAFFVASIQRSDGTARVGDSARFHHLAGGAFALLVLMSLLMGRWDGHVLDRPWQNIAGTLAVLLLAFAPHAGLTLAALRGTAMPAAAPWRLAGFVLLAWALTAVALWQETGPRGALLWPLEAGAIVATRVAERAAFRSVGASALGTRAGERQPLLLEQDRPVDAVIPPGWLGTAPRQRLLQRRPPATSVEIARDPRQPQPPGSPATRILVREGAQMWELRSIEMRDRIRAPSLWGDFGCTAPEARFGDLVACRRVSTDHRPIDTALAERLPDDVLRHRILMETWDGERRYRLVGPGVRATCEVGRDCRFWFPAGTRSGAWVTLPEAERHRWRAARDEADALLRAMLGFGIETRPTVLQPDGVVLPGLE